MDRSPRLHLLIAALAGLAPGAVVARAQAKLPGESRPYVGFYEPSLQTQLDERVKRSVRDLGDERAGQRDLAVRDLVLIGEPAVEALRAAIDDRQDAVRRAALRALVALSPTVETFDAVERIARGIERSYEVPFFAVVLFGEPAGSDAERAERARRLGVLARQGKAILAIPPLLGLLRLDVAPPNVQELRELVERGGDSAQVGLQALVLGRLDPGSAASLARPLVGRRSPDFVRACTAWALSYVGGGRGIEGFDPAVDLASSSTVLAACTALAAIPRNDQEVESARDLILDGEVAEAARTGLVTALALSEVPGVPAALLGIASSPARREGLREVLLQAAVRRGDLALLLAIAGSVPPDPQLEAKLFAGACGVLTHARDALPPALVAAPPPAVLEPLIAKAQERLRRGPLPGALEAATFLLLVGAPWPGDVDPAVAADPDLRAVARLARVTAERPGDVERSTLRRLGLAVAIENQVDAEAKRDELLHELLWTGLGRRQQPFHLKGFNDLEPPEDAQNFPVAHHGPFYEDLRFFLESRPFRTRLERHLRGR